MTARILWVDCIGAGLVGVVMFLLRDWISSWYRLPVEFIIVMGVANLLYGSYSFSLVMRSRRTLGMIRLLVVANASWAMFCILAAVAWAGRASAFGLASLTLEGLYVGGLAALEWRQRDELVRER